MVHHQNWRPLPHRGHAKPNQRGAKKLCEKGPFLLQISDQVVSEIFLAKFARDTALAKSKKIKSPLFELFS